jgi:hypothetical protein
MEKAQLCPECGSAWRDGQTCQDHFHQMLYWEFENPDLGVVHHLMVLCYHLQHPSLYSPEGLRYSMQLLVDFVERGVSPQESRQRSRAIVDSGNRKWKITATPTSRGSYAHPIQWPMTAADVIAGGADHYCENVRAWARSMFEMLNATGNLNTQ